MEEEASQQSSPSSKVFSVRIVSIDYYMAPPIPDLDFSYSTFQGGKVNEVPVIRIYGSTPAGQKACVHVHRALPYFYIPCADLKLAPDIQGDACTNLISQLVEKALKLKGTAGSKRQHVHSCSLVRAKRLYGYYKSEEIFAKMYLYHPHDVSRAASLFLGSAVLDRSVQPHESHIPFLLQFLVDYNLYGMGHMHVSKMKFRQPVPTAITPKKLHYDAHRNGSDNLAIGSAGLQADSSNNAAACPPIWISTTIPDSWIWGIFNQVDFSLSEGVPFVKRQSTCELEGDAIVADILNQNIKIYTSLSQTRSDVRMVQSLIPIWEEEYERTGMHEVMLLSDPSKPPPRDVLWDLSNGLDLENQLLELCNETEINLTCVPFDKDDGYAKSMAALTDVRNVVNLLDSEKVVEEALKCSSVYNESKTMSPRASPSESTTIHGERQAVCYEQLVLNDVQTSQKIGSSDVKIVDREAMGLLSWLASSQAAEDIHSDDELACETILSPLLPATSINKVLEKANTNFESESQKECQDILDSVEDSMDFGGLKERSSSTDPSELNHSSPGRIIPQVDGSADDQDSVPYAKNSSEKDTSTCHGIFPPENVIESISGDKAESIRSKSLWGSLSFCSPQRVNDDLNGLGGCSSEIKGSANRISRPESEGDRETPDSEAGSNLIRCSVRDLMRRKRRGWSEPYKQDDQMVRKEESNYPKDSEPCTSEGKEPQDVANSEPSMPGPVTEALDRGSCKATIALNSYGNIPLLKTHLSSYESVARKPLKRVKSANINFIVSLGCSEKGNIQESEGTGVMAALRSEVCTLIPDQVILSPNPDTIKQQRINERLNLKDGDGATCSNECSLQEEILGSDQNVFKNSYERESFRQSVAEIPSTNIVGKEAATVSTCIQSENFGDAKSSRVTNSLVPGFSASPAMNFDADSEEPIVPRRLVDEFHSVSECSGSFQDGTVLSKISTGEEVNCHRDSVGVPAHYQNDGSYLYVLTRKSLPPSVEGVSRWLLHDSADHEEKNSAAANLESPSPTGFSNNQINFEDLFSDSFETSSPKPVLESRSEPIVEPKEPLPKINVQMLAPDRKAKEVCQSDCNIMSQRGFYDCSPDDISQISGPDGKSKATPLSQIGFRDPASFGMGQQLTLLSIEVQAESRGELRPDPRFDAINLIVLAFQEDNSSNLEVHVLLRSDTEHIQRNIDGVLECKMFFFPDEKQLFGHLIDIICSTNPDILVGWDIQGYSLGFLAERAVHLGIRLLNGISRTPTELKLDSRETGVPVTGKLDDVIPEPMVSDSNAVIEDEWGRTHASGIHVSGRIVLNIWRLMRGELKLHMYSFEAVVDAVLRQKVPFIHFKVLTRWFLSGPARARHRCIEYMVKRASLNLEILDQLDMINRTSELARVFGIDFFSVLSRGSQYRVESMLLRLAHTQNYVAISPGSQQVASQPAMECIPLVMEPESGFYADPVVVLDFQSLYPSMIIAYNLCFCTCLGNVIPSKTNILGVSSYSPDLDVLRELNLETLVTPNGVMYVPSKVRRGVLPRLLDEILSTRIMVKKAMKKLGPSQQVLHRIFNARQLALKLIANVTYGYTAAGFSGRMPCAELADSIVQCGRKTLEKAILFVNTHDKWKAKVIYGDTDSMFVLLKGRNVKEAFEIGHEIASAVTAANPAPVTLKMEKVYHPCFLLTKKRYVGYSYESPDQVKPLFDAKGIETVRRDTCGAVAKTMEHSLRFFFEHQDANKVKAYLLRQWTRILSGRISLQDFIFAKEVRLGTYSTNASSSLPAAAIVANKAMRGDPRAAPRYGERIPYVVVHGEPGSRLVDMVVDPLELLAVDSPFRLNDMYYIKKQIIPALQRVFGLVGADLNLWLSSMPRPGRESIAKRNTYASNSHRTRIDCYYLSKHCVLCGEVIQGSGHVCGECWKNETAVAAIIIGRTSKLEKNIHHLAAICRHCGGGDWILESGVKCTSLACPVFYERRKVQKELQSLSSVATDAGLYPTCTVEWF